MAAFRRPVGLRGWRKKMAAFRRPVGLRGWWGAVGGAISAAGALNGQKAVDRIAPRGGTAIRTAAQHSGEGRN